MSALSLSFPFHDSFPRTRRFRIVALGCLLCAAAHAQSQCPGYVETDAGSAFDIATLIKDSGSPQSALNRVQRAVSKVDAGGGCTIFSDRKACEETLTLAHKAIVALQTCSAVSTPKGAARG